jgi:HAD superfamily hydrolase (TIGR01490 family)
VRVIGHEFDGGVIAADASLQLEGADVQVERPRVPMAIFDLDRTVLRGSSLPMVAKALVDAGLLRRRVLADALVRNAVFQRRGCGDETVTRLVGQVLSMVAGMDADRVRAAVESVQFDLLAQSRPELRRLITEHRANGDLCVVLTASPVEVAELVASGLGAHCGIGTRSEVVAGHYTGQLVGPVCYGRAKVASLEANPVRPQWASSIAYSDSVSDLPLLRAAGRAVVVCPDRHLRREARTQGWQFLTVDRH